MMNRDHHVGAGKRVGFTGGNTSRGAGDSGVTGVVSGASGVVGGVVNAGCPAANRRAVETDTVQLTSTWTDMYLRG